MRSANYDEAWLDHLSKMVWRCPFCNKEAIRYDKLKDVFVCWECCKLLTEEEGHKLLKGFWANKSDDERQHYLRSD